MKKIVALVTLIVTLISCTEETKISTVHQYLDKLKSSTTRNGFPFELVNNALLPNFNTNDQFFIMEKSLLGSEALLYDGDNHQVKKVNLNNLQTTGTINFSSLPSGNFLKFVGLNQDLMIWYNDSNQLFVYDVSGNYIKTINLNLNYQNKQYAISLSSHAQMEYFPTSKQLIFPVQCISEYEESETHSIPQFASYNLNTNQTTFLPIYLPNNYPADKYLGRCMEPYTAYEGNNFYVLYPLSNQVYRYDVLTSTVNTINLQLPVSLSNPALIQEPVNYQQTGDLIYNTNHIDGFAVINGQLIVQQTDAWDNNLASPQFIDNTVLYSFNQNGQLDWSGPFPHDVFGGIGMFRISFAKEGNLNFLAVNRNNELRLIQLTTGS
jgi:hypothetical protein